MEEKIGIVNAPSVDFQPYLGRFLEFIGTNYPDFISFVKSLIGILIGVSIPISILLFIGIIITVEKLKAIRRKESLIYDAKIEMGYADVSSQAPKENRELAKKWDTVLKHVESTNANDWRQAVIEADIILGEVLTNLGYRGEGIGEQLKRATKADFKTLDEAWEAHKVRNELAHAGSDFPFSQFDARRVIQLYRKVFEEFFHI